MSIESLQMAPAASTYFYIHLRTNFNTLGCYYFPGLPDLVSSQQVIFAFIIATLLNFLQIMYHQKPKSPFETHPNTTLLAIGSLLMYCLSYDIRLRLRVTENHHTANYFFRTSMAFFGTVSVACLSSILFPHWLCSLLFILAVLYILSYLPGFDIQTIWNWWPAVTALLRRQQQRRASLQGLFQFNCHGSQKDDIIDQFDQLPV